MQIKKAYLGLSIKDVWVLIKVYGFIAFYCLIFRAQTILGNVIVNFCIAVHMPQAVTHPSCPCTGLRKDFCMIKHVVGWG